MGVAIAEREVSRVDGCRVAFVLYAHPHIREREVGVGGAGDGNRLNAVALMVAACSIEGVAQTHVGIQRVVLRTRLLLRHRVVERCRHLRLVGEELTQLERSGDAVGLIVVGAALCHTLLESTEAFRGVAALHVHGAKVGELHVQIALCCPAAFVVVFLQSQLVHPNLSRLCRTAKVAHTDDHGLHLTKRGITHDGDLVLRAVLVVLGVETVVACRAFRLCAVAGFLQSGEDAQRHIEHVLLRPHGTAVLRRVAVVVSLGREL